MTVKRWHRSCGLLLRICIHWKRTDRKLCSETRKVSAHCREKYGEKAGFCSGEGRNGRMNQSRQSAWPCSSSACFWKNSWVFSRLPFWEKQSNRIRTSEGCCVLGPRILLMRLPGWCWWRSICTSWFSACSPWSCKCPPAWRTAVCPGTASNPSGQRSQSSGQTAATDQWSYLPADRKKLFHYAVHQSLSEGKTNYLKGSHEGDILTAIRLLSFWVTALNRKGKCCKRRMEKEEKRNRMKKWKRPNRTCEFWDTDLPWSLSLCLLWSHCPDVSAYS